MKTKILIFLIFIPIMAFSQETAVDFFTKISNNYANLEAYTAKFKFTSGLEGNIVQEGELSYMSPNLLRLDYTTPKDQVLSINSTKMSLYVPSERTLFEQQINSEQDAQAMDVTGLTSQGLSLFKMNYSISYLNSPATEALDEDNPEEVYKLRLYPRKSAEMFKRITLSISIDGFIRRIESIKRDDEVIVLDIVDINTDVELANTLFDYDAPPTATTVTDFLFIYEEEE